LYEPIIEDIKAFKQQEQSRKLEEELKLTLQFI
jgi:hypothetical protein